MKTFEEAADKWVFETNGHKWSNNDNTAGDNYGSFIQGAKWQQERSYSEEDIENIWNEFVKELPPINNGASSDFLLYLKQFKKK